MCVCVCVAWNLIWCAIQNICSSCYIITISFCCCSYCCCCCGYCSFGILFPSSMRCGCGYMDDEVGSALYTNEIHSDSNFEFCEYAKICCLAFSNDNWQCHSLRLELSKVLYGEWVCEGRWINIVMFAIFSVNLRQAKGNKLEKKGISWSKRE